jgi:Bacterial capsule synthesis protein PGA_cap
MNSDIVSINFVGDIAFSDPIKKRYQKHGIDPFFYISDELKKSDFVVGNFEFPIQPQNEIGNMLRMELVNNKIRVLSLSNNHVLDYGHEGVLYTKNWLNSVGVIPVGVGYKNSIDHCKITKKNIKFAFLGYCKKGCWSASNEKLGAGILDENKIKDDIFSLKSKVDHIIVLVHWGTEYVDYPTPSDIKLGRSLIDYGARVVIGTHPHVYQGFEEYHDGMIFYSLGNFIYDRFADSVIIDENTRKQKDTIIIQMKFCKESIHDYKLTPCEINNSSQVLLPSIRRKDEILERVMILSNNINNNNYFKSIPDSLIRRELETYRNQLSQNGYIWIGKQIIHRINMKNIRLLISFFLRKIF